MALLGKYNAKDCTVTVDGTYITGLGEDMITWEKAEAYFETSVGAQGDIVKSTINNDIHTLGVTVQQTSPQYGFLMNLAKRQDEFPVWVMNKALGITVGGSLASVEEQSEVNMGQTAEDVTFNFTVFDGVTKAD